MFKENGFLFSCFLRFAYKNLKKKYTKQKMNDHQHEENCKCQTTTAVQSLDEMEFDRGIWSAGKF